jgi:thioredoxin 1
MSLQITSNQFRKEVLENSHLSLVHFKKEWNGACQIISPIFEDLTRSYKSIVKFFTVDTDKEKFIANEFGINEIPAILFFRNGQIIDHSIGLISKNDLISKIENALTETKNL